MTTPSEISDWFDRGIREGATHMAVLTDTFEWRDYPAYIWADDANDAIAQVRKHLVNMTSLREVYHLHSDKARQLAEEVATNYAPL